MKKLQFLAWPKLCTAALLGAGALFMASCAQDGYDDKESWETSVKNTQMVSPSTDGIKVSSSADGLTMNIVWTVVQGAGGYQFDLYNVNDANNPVLVMSRKVDGCSVEGVPREEDTNYRLELKTLGNSSLGNTDATSTTVKAFTTFTPTYKTIPNGTELVAWFAENPVPDSNSDTWKEFRTTNELDADTIYYDLEAGGAYTLDGLLDFKGHKVVLRSNSKTNQATVTYGTEGEISIDQCFGLKYLVFNCGNTSKDIITTSATPTTTADSKGFYIIEDPVGVQNCTFNDVPNSLIGGAKVSDTNRFCIKTFLLNNCVVKLKTSDKMSSTAIINMYKNRGFINSLTVQNSTFYNTSEFQAKYFIQYENNMNCNQLENKLSNSYVTISNNTFYNVVKGNQFANWSGIGGKNVTIYNVKANIFVDCSIEGQIARRIIVNKSNPEMNFAYNTYYLDGADTSEKEASYDTGIILKSNPGFKNAAAGDFTISGDDQLANQTGDPRWIK